MHIHTLATVFIINHYRGSYVGMTWEKHSCPYIRNDCIFTENSLLVHFGNFYVLLREEIGSMEKLKTPDLVIELVRICHFKNGRLIMDWLVLVCRTFFVLV